MCFERARVAGWRPRGNDFVRDSRGIGGEPRCFGFEERWRTRSLPVAKEVVGGRGERKAHWSGTVLARRAEHQSTTNPAGLMSYSIVGPVGPREQGWQCAPFGRPCIGDIVTGPGRSVVGSAHDSPVLAAESE